VVDPHPRDRPVTPGSGAGPAGEPAAPGPRLTDRCVGPGPRPTDRRTGPGSAGRAGGAGPGSAREVVLGRIRVALGDRPGPVEVPRAYRTVGDLDRPALLDLLVDRLLDYQASVRRCSPAELPGTLAAAVAGRRVVVPPGLPWELPGAVRDDGLTAHELDALDGVVTACAVAVAETGTIVLDAGPDQGRRAITLVPDHHLLVVRAEQVVQTVPEAVARLDPTRPLTWISGPSATSDIELHRVEGVHGPRILDVVLVG
jgi:L-lactate dehydrogenase complex protein LldG